MKRRVKRKPYDSSKRRAAAQQTRHQILAAARETFLARGYAAATMSEIATAAGVNLDTIYTTIGRKAALFRLLIEAALSGMPAPVAALERRYVADIRSAASARRKLELYAGAVTAIQQRLAPLFLVLRDAGAQDQEIAQVWADISRRRAENMRLFAAEVAASARLGPDFDTERAADIIWSMNATEYYAMLVLERGWTAAAFERWLADAWSVVFFGPNPSAKATG